MKGHKITVAENNDHLGLIVSGLDEEQKNTDNNINKCRKSLFALLGSAFSYNCKLSPTTQIHLWRTYNLPVLLSGLSALPIRPSHITTLTTFHHKILRGFLHLSSTAPVPSLYFLLGELPIEARLHQDIFSLFFNIWANPSSKVHLLVILAYDGWQQLHHVGNSCKDYLLYVWPPWPLLLLQQPVWPKSQWKLLTQNRVTVYILEDVKRIFVLIYKTIGYLLYLQKTFL